MLKIKKLSVIAILAIGMSLFTSNVAAWNFTGHVVVAQIAYDNLNPQAKNKVDQLSSNLFNELPEKLQIRLNKHYANASTFAKLAVLGDYWRKWQFGTIFRTYHANLPLQLLFYSNQSTEQWHFIDRPYPTTSLCHLADNQNVVAAINLLEVDFPKTTDDSARAVEMVLEEHYVGDIHQPLHTFARYGAACQNDLGGNLFCLKTNAKGRCTKNLHQLWDGGLGYLKPKANIQQMAFKLEQLYPEKSFSSQLSDQNVADWAKSNYQYANFIYGLPENKKPTPDYYKQGQAIAKSQLALAGYRLARLLNTELVN